MKVLGDWKFIWADVGDVYSSKSSKFSNHPTVTSTP